MKNGTGKEALHWGTVDSSLKANKQLVRHGAVQDLVEVEKIRSTRPAEILDFSRKAELKIRCNIGLIGRSTCTLKLDRWNVS